MKAGRPKNKEPTKYLGVRVPASVFDPVKQFADDHAERMSGIVIEALKLYTGLIILHQCDQCGCDIPEGSNYCPRCGIAVKIGVRRV